MNKGFAALILMSLLVLLVEVPMAHADRRPTGMVGGETNQATALIAPASDGAFYRAVERKLKAAMNSLNYSDYTAARIHLRWAQANLNNHGSYQDKQLAGQVGVALSFIRHYQIAQAVQIMRQLLAQVHSLGWGSAISITTPAPSQTTDKRSRVEAELLQKTINHLKDKQVNSARTSLKALNKSVTTKASSTNADAVRVLKSIDLHFDSHSQDTKELIETLENLKKELKN